MSLGTLSGAWSAPASTSTTLFPGSSESRAAITQPAEPPPITRCVACISLSPSFESLSPSFERTVHPILAGGIPQTNRLAGHLTRVADINEAHAGAVEHGVVDRRQLLRQQPSHTVSPIPRREGCGALLISSQLDPRRNTISGAGSHHG